MSQQQFEVPRLEGILSAVSSSASSLQDGLRAFQRRPTILAVANSQAEKAAFKATIRNNVLRAVDLKATVLGVASMGGLIATAAQAALSPQGPGTCDRNMCERCCNIATSAPYVVCGCHAMRNRRTASGKTWGASLVGVGCASAVFHGSYGSFREWGRRMDFWTIAAASNLMTRALFPGVPAAVTAAGMLATPFKPFLVSFVNSTAMELKFLAAARRNPKLRGPQRLHAVCCLAGLGAFALEDWKPELPLVHSVWHLLSTTAVATVNHLLADVEEQQEQKQRLLQGLAQGLDRAHRQAHMHPVTVGLGGLGGGFGNSGGSSDSGDQDCRALQLGLEMQVQPLEA